ncbi:hypothetical protein E4R31_13500 [Salmonella enterica]|nr:hypothetical protein [Salmonella enterica]ELK2414080.1 hypothetical protein [Salmonella enterica]
MFKLVITLVNHEKGNARKLESPTRYKGRKAAENDARKMEYIRISDSGKITHECKVKIVEV